MDEEQIEAVLEQVAEILEKASAAVTVSQCKAAVKRAFLLIEETLDEIRADDGEEDDEEDDEEGVEVEDDEEDDDEEEEEHETADVIEEGA